MLTKQYEKTELRKDCTLGVMPGARDKFLRTPDSLTSLHPLGDEGRGLLKASLRDFALIARSTVVPMAMKATQNHPA